MQKHPTKYIRVRFINRQQNKECLRSGIDLLQDLFIRNFGRQIFRYSEKPKRRDADVFYEFRWVLRRDRLAEWKWKGVRLE